MPKGMLSMLKSQLGGISSQDSAAVDAGSAAAAVAAESAMVAVSYLDR